MGPRDLGPCELRFGHPDPGLRAATISGRASESRRAVARLIGKPRSVDSSGADFSSTAFWSGEGDPETRGAGDGGGGWGISWAQALLGGFDDW